MKKLCFLLVAILAVSLFTTPARAAIAQSSGYMADPRPAAQKMSEAICQITGVAISPLLGVSGVGAWKYFHAKTPEEKAALPWFADPLFWVPAFIIVGLCFAKDSGGLVLPPGMKKPFDVMETAEHKLSGLVATGAFVPIAASIFQMRHPDGAGLHLSSLGFASIDFGGVLGNAIMVPVSMVVFAMVFLASNAIQILILISPFGQVDAALKAFRTTILASVVGTSAFGSWSGHPWIGAAWALVVILISWLIAGWSFRLSHFGLVFVWDYFTGRKHRFHPDAKANRMFLSRKLEKVPARTYGTLARDDKGQLVLNYRPWLVLPQRTLVMPEGRYETGRGIFYSEILKVDGDSAKTVILLPPRYLGHEEELAKVYNLAGTRDVGLRAAWAWFKSLFVGKEAAT